MFFNNNFKREIFIDFAEISREGDIAEEDPVKPASVPLTARHQIFAELQQTEKNYCDTLVTLIKVQLIVLVKYL